MSSVVRAINCLKDVVQQILNLLTTQNNYVEQIGMVYRVGTTPFPMPAPQVKTVTLTVMYGVVNISLDGGATYPVRVIKGSWTFGTGNNYVDVTNLVFRGDNVSAQYTVHWEI